MKRAHLRKRSSLIRSSIFVIVATFTCLGFLENPIFAQTRETTTDGSTPLGIAPGTPSGSYPLSDLDTVNLYNGGLNFSLPLLKIAGRGGAGYTMIVKIEPKFAVQKEQEFGQPTRYYADESWWIGEPMFSMGRLDVRHGIKNQYHVVCGKVAPTETLTRLTFTAPDGTEYEMRDQRTGGQPDHPTCAGLNRGTVFTTTDGSAATFISDNDIVDDAWDGSSETYASGYLMLRDGTRFRIDNSLISWMRDRNGNKLTFTYDGSRRLTAVTDSLNRIVTITYGGTYGYDQIAFKGFAGADRTVRLYRAALRDALRTGFSELTPMQLFPELDGGGAGASKPVMSAIELPNGQKYQFKYNPYGELARVELPTGGAFEYDWAAGTTDGAASGVISITGNKQIYRRVIERRIYPDGGTGSSFASRMTYSRPESSTSNAGYVIADQYKSDGTLLTRSYHYFYGSARSSLFQLPTQYPGWKDGKEYQTVNYANAGTAATQTNTTFAQRAAVSWFSGNPDQEPPNDVRVVETTTTLLDTNQVSKRTSVNPNNSNDSGFDQYNNQTDVWEYGYGASAPGGLVRHTHTDYVTADSYTDAFMGAHIRNLPKQTSVYDQNGNEGGRTVFEYDNYGTENYHALIRTYPRAGFNELPISGLDPAFNSQTANLTRGNVTATTRYLLNASGAVTGSITSYAQYDIAGNVVEAIDARGYATTFDFRDNFGTSDDSTVESGGDPSNSAPPALGTETTYAFAFKITNALGHSAYSKYDHNLGRAVVAEDANGTIFRGYFDNVLDRPTRLIRAANQTSIKSQTTFEYDDVLHLITTKSDQTAYDDNVLKSQIVYDGLGRTIESRQYETSSAFIAVQTEYDALGRAYKVSNPFRPLSPHNETPVWTTTVFDSLSRVISVTTTRDNAIVATAYNGDRVLVTDQSGKQRISRSNALGQLKDIWEARSADSDTESISFPNHPEVTAGYHTSYNYDTLDNLIQVAQGDQQPARIFTYDSLKRLTSATNPESGTVCYGRVVGGECQKDGYDANGNLIYKTDARGILTTYAYDELNRNTGVSYSNDPANTPTVTRTYDGAINGKGRLWKTQTVGVSLTTMDEYDALGRPTKITQQFFVNNTWGQPFIVAATYDKAGHVLSESYPSNHFVNYNYDGAGRLADKDAQHLAFTGNLGDGSTRTYASALEYTAQNSLQQEKFGMQTPLYHKLHYNVRGQLYDVRVSTLSLAQGEFDWNRGCLAFYYGGVAWGQSGAANNGNVTKQEHWIPVNESLNDYIYTQDTYSYDSLNRLSSVTELHGGPWGQSAPDYQQSYSYDRYGNRTIDYSNTTPNVPRPQFGVDTDTNRLTVPSGQSGVIHYDAAGNLDIDTHSSSAVSRVYDAENRMKSESQGNAQPAGEYTYDGDGRRIKRKVNGTETWQVYGLGGELLAEYAANADALSPQKEFGYRNGELLITADVPQTPNLNGYAYRRTLSIDHSKVPNTDQTNFPVLISGTYSYLATTTNGGNVQSANGYDVIFTADAGCATKLDHEVERYNAATGEVSYWVKVPTVSHSSDTVIYMCYGNSGITADQSNRTGVWNGNFKGVYHLSDNAANTTVADSTANGNNGANAANTSARTTSGQIGQGMSYNGSTDLTTTSLTPAKSFTWECWFKLTDWTTQSGSYNYSALMTTNYATSADWAMLLLWKDSQYGVQFASDNGGGMTTGNGSVAPGSWHQIAYSRTGDNGTYALYLDGVLQGTLSGGVANVTSTITLGSRRDYPAQALNGVLDEVRVSNTARSADWIKTEYNNQSSPSAFYSISGATSGGGGTATVHWLVTDQLGTSRMVFDQSGDLTVLDQNGNYVRGVTRHDYLPFGEELDAGVGGRTTAQGYSASDRVRQKFTGYEHDSESGLDYAHARYYASSQGRFTSPDPLAGSASTANPQSFNRYSYVNNSPLIIVDPSGMFGICPGGGQGGMYVGGSVPEEEQRPQQQPATTPSQSQPSQQVAPPPLHYFVACTGNPQTAVAVPQPAEDALNQYQTSVANNVYDTLSTAYSIEQNPTIQESRGVNLTLTVGSSGVNGGISATDQAIVKTPAEATTSLTQANDRAAPFRVVNESVIIDPCTNKPARLDQIPFEGGGSIAANLVRTARVNGNNAGRDQWTANYPNRQLPAPFQPYLLPVRANRIH